MVLDRIQCDNAIKEIISDKTKLKELPKMLLLNQKLNSKDSYEHLELRKKCLNDLDCKFIYASDSAPANIYGTPKIHKLTDSDSFHKLRPIVSSAGTYNYNLAKYLCNLLSHHLPEQYSGNDTFTFV